MLAPSVSAQMDLGMQQQMNAFTDSGVEQMQLTVGEILEILPTSDLQSPTYSWILTQDRTFIQAARTETFRYRFIQPGAYSLIAEIKSGDQSTSILRTFNINAKARNPGDVGMGMSSAPAMPGSGNTLMGLVKIDPPMDTNQRVVLPNGQQLLKLSPLNPDVKPLSLDLDTKRDTDNDGNPSNDVQNQATFFQLYAEPLYIWFASPLTTRTMAVTTVGADGNARVQNIETTTALFAQNNGMIVSPIHMTSTPGENGSYSFTAMSLNGSTQSSFLYHWSFGDGEESLAMNPTHTYAANGTYTVTLQVKNLIDGQDAAKDQQQISVQNAGVAPVSAASSQSSNGGTVIASNNWSLLSILIGLGIFLLCAILGLAGVFFLSKLRRGKSLDQTFADMEKTIVAKDDTTKTPPPLVIPAATVPAAAKQSAPVATPAPTKEDISKREENAASSAPVAETARIDEKAAPSWLKKGLDTPPKPATPPAPAAPAVNTPAPAPVPTPAIPKPAPAPASAPKPATPAPAPAWLKQSTPPVAASAPAPTPAPIPAPVVAPKPTPTPAAPIVTTQPAPTSVQAPAVPMPKPVPAPATPPVVAPTPQAVPTPAPVAPTPAPAPVVVPKPTPAPMPAPVPAPAVSLPKPTPVTAPTVSTPTPAPVPVPMPKPTPTPATPVVVPTPVQTPIAPPMPKPVPAPTPIVTPPAPKPEPVPVPVPKPMPTPAPQASVAPVQSQAPTPINPPAAPKPIPVPVPMPKPVPAPTPTTPISTPIQQTPLTPAPIPTPAPAPKPIESADTPIAIIRADSLDSQQFPSF